MFVQVDGTEQCMNVIIFLLKSPAETELSFLAFRYQQQKRHAIASEGRRFLYYAQLKITTMCMGEQQQQSSDKWSIITCYFILIATVST